MSETPTKPMDAIDREKLKLNVSTVLAPLAQRLPDSYLWVRLSGVIDAINAAPSLPPQGVTRDEVNRAIEKWRDDGWMADGDSQRLLSRIEELFDAHSPDPFPEPPPPTEHPTEYPPYPTAAEAAKAEPAPSEGGDVPGLIEGKTPWEFTCGWYPIEEIAHSLAAEEKRRGTLAQRETDMPTNVWSPSFAEWLTNQYRLAMCKGIEFGQRSRVSPSPRVAELEAEDWPQRFATYAVCIDGFDSLSPDWQRVCMDAAEWAKQRVQEATTGLTAERDQLRGAINRAGFRVMQTSGDWSIHDVSKLGEEEARRTAEVVAENADLTAQLAAINANMDDNAVPPHADANERLTWVFGQLADAERKCERLPDKLAEAERERDRAIEDRDTNALVRQEQKHEAERRDAALNRIRLAFAIGDKTPEEIAAEVEAWANRPCELSAESARLAGELREAKAKLVAADAMAFAVDEMVARKALGSRSQVSDARLNYGDPFKYEYMKPSASPSPEPEPVERPQLHGHEVCATTSHGVRLDGHGQPICPRCGKLTNSAYAAHSKMVCWKCGELLADFSTASGNAGEGQ